MKRRNKCVAVVLLFLVLFSNLVPSVTAVEISNAYLENGPSCAGHLQYNFSGTWGDIRGNLIHYNLNGVRYPAYCISHPQTPGVDDVGNYNVNITELLDDVRIWRVIINGYPYQTPAQMGVETDEDAYMATKQAIYSVMFDRNVTAVYRGKDARGNKILNAMVRLVDIGRNGTQTPQQSNLSAQKIGTLIEDGNYYYQEFSVTSAVNISEYKISSTTNMPKDSFIANMNGIATNTFSGAEHFKLMIPKSSLREDISNVAIGVQGKCKTYPVFYGVTTVSGWQDYAVTFDPYGDDNTILRFNYKTNTASIKLIKSDKDTGEKLAGIVFNAKYEDGTNIGDFTTDSNGVITINGLRQGKVILTEKSTLSNYILNTDVIEVETLFNKTSTVEVTNEHKKGNIEIVKVDKDDNDITLGAVEFDLIDSNNNVVKHIVTDVNGKAKITNINIGNYTLRETLTKNEYNLAVDQNVEVKWNEITNVKVENEKKKGQIKVIKIDKDYNEVKLEGVEFQVIDKNNHVIETIKTDHNGEAATSRIPIGNYKIKEVSLGTNEEYILNDEVKTIVVEEDKINNMTFENEHKKGNLKIYKVDLDDEKLPVSDVEFEITDQDGYKYYAKSDENGIAYIENIRTGIASIKELKTNAIYKPSTETYDVEIKYDETSEITIKNEKLKGQIEVNKVDAEDNEYKLEGVEFEVINSDGKVVETIVTDKDGYAKTSRIPIGSYTLRETKTDEMHILNTQIFKVNVETDIVSTLDITNERIKGQIKVIKTSEDDNFINDKEAGSPIPNVEFEVYDANNTLVDKIVTMEDGTCITRLLDKGKYKIKEVTSGEWYLLNTDVFDAEIKTHGEVIEVNITNESEKPDVDITKTGIIQTTANQEIRYDFKIKNTGNVPLSKFTWIDSLPIDYVRITKLITGTYNQDLNYSIYYKTNKNDYRLLKDNLNTQVNNYIDFSNLELDKDEYVTYFKADFGVVDVGFESVIDPYIFVRVNSNVKNEDKFTNKTRIEGYNKTYMVWDEDEHTTKVYEKEVTVKKLPKTGC